MIGLACLRRPRPALPGLLAAGLLLFFAAGCGVNGEAAAEIDPGKIVSAFVGDLEAGATASGQLEARRRASLSVSGGGVVQAVHIRVGDRVRAGDLLVELETADLELALAAAEQNLLVRQADLADLQQPAGELEVAAAEADVAGARAALANLMDGPAVEEIAVTEASLREAEAAVFSSSSRVGSARNAVTAADIEAARAALTAAEFQLERAQAINERIAVDRTDQALRDARQAYDEALARYNRLTAGGDAGEIAASEADLTAAMVRRSGSQADLDALLAGPTAAEIAAAQATLAQAEAALADLLAGPAEAQVRIAEAEVAQAALNLEEAQVRLAEARLTAPFDGIVTAINFREGELASGIVATLVDDRSFELVLSVDEADIVGIAVGQSAELTLVSFPDRPLSSAVRAIAPSASASSSGIVAYDVHLALEPTDLPLRIGQTADARLITDQQRGILLVPNAAIRADRQAGKYYVNRLAGGAITEIEITIGLRDRQHTQVTSGLEAGDELVIGYEPVEADQNGPGGPGPGGGPFGG